MCWREGKKSFRAVFFSRTKFGLKKKLFVNSTAHSRIFANRISTYILIPIVESPRFQQREKEKELYIKKRTVEWKLFVSPLSHFYSFYFSSPNCWLMVGKKEWKSVRTWVTLKASSLIEKSSVPIPPKWLWIYILTELFSSRFSFSNPSISTKHITLFSLHLLWKKRERCTDRQLAQMRTSDGAFKRIFFLVPSFFGRCQLSFFKKGFHCFT